MTDAKKHMHASKTNRVNMQVNQNKMGLCPKESGFYLEQSETGASSSVYLGKKLLKLPQHLGPINI